MPSLEDQIYDLETKLAEAQRSGTEVQRVQLTTMLARLREQRAMTVGR
ncbi:hypothetical protein HYG77_04820 [Rhodococcus sp. ZPP]|nr:hypothetical protein [Rhodococcus sp. ZPP]QTJ64986.1 hypothetical protein HYG77_04820 [Rhodococcus sp. ZPP]